MHVLTSGGIEPPRRFRPARIQRQSCQPYYQCRPHSRATIFTWSILAIMPNREICTVLTHDYQHVACLGVKHQDNHRLVDAVGIPLTTSPSTNLNEGTDGFWVDLETTLTRDPTSRQSSQKPRCHVSSFTFGVLSMAITTVNTTYVMLLSQHHDLWSTLARTCGHGTCTC